ncbi:tRNA (adenosine(37)-N6)-threonylcarbamoyltransferase complex dimerization subunit type 1 TsaB [Ramlibacter algicola]|uniref:tRNA (Adenosine(37)-N6)-threonylcarbamoyltransferase complex dimerization subunit type 1 TsaB n=1 Tax=Ramlibacter algicola TaxID=2795217 RepID=A0A934PVH3_9BURK|nr:tRNA (adenosine(37)-N6)-threonylcarbamoyltransferase complex dimerization subunit type 1 TsaB [Ramlibacter algicola]MBK0391220.1 tRNA (adenosine(37)-N6)-threonylcarbamoyltransferase complex dimerization subunit type 1 TsaB [Ramlibacter algicola]
MKLLAFDTSTDALSIAVAAPGLLAPLDHRGAGGAQASTTLLPAVLDLLGRAGLVLAELDAIAFGCGPGSFTGLRTACSAAQGLALGAGVPVLPVETLMLVAEQAREQRGAADVLALLDARMNEVYAARYRHDGQRWHREGGIVLAAPEAITAPAGVLQAGNAFAAYGDRLPAGDRIDVIPSALALVRLAPALLAAGEAVAADDALPLYVRDKVAQTTAEREAARAAAAQATMRP